MSFSAGVQRDLYYAEESAFGAGDNLDTMKEVRNKEDSISLGRDSFVSEELRGDRGVHDMRLGNKQPSGDIACEFSYESFDDFMLAGLGDVEWVDAFSALTVESTVVATARTITRTSGNWLADGVKVGDTLTIAMTGLTSDAIGKVESVTDTVITLAEGATNLEDVTVAEDATITTDSKIIKKGSTIHSFVIEKAFTDIDEYQLYSGGVVNTMSLELAPNAMITGSFGMLFKDGVNATDAYHIGTPASVSTYRPFDGFSGYILENGETLAHASGVSISLDNGFNRNFVLMQKTCPQMTIGKSNITGSVTLYFENSDIYNKFVNEIESALEFQLKDDLDNSYVVSLPRIKYSSAETPVPSGDAILNTMNFQALDDVTEGTNIIIRKQPAIA